MLGTNQTKKVESIIPNNLENILKEESNNIKNNSKSLLNTNMNRETENTKNNFIDKFYPLLMTNEGGYVNDEDDRGGETYKGISRKNNPSWEGWKTIDELNEEGLIEYNKLFPQLDESVRKFYDENYFNKSRADEFNDWGLAGQYTDAFVHTGEGNAVKTLRKAINNASKELKDHFEVDETSTAPLNDKEIEYINRYSRKIYDKFKEARKNYYNKIVDNNSSQKKYINGWINRIDEIDKNFIPNISLWDLPPFNYDFLESK